MVMVCKKCHKSKKGYKCGICKPARLHNIKRKGTKAYNLKKKRK